MDSITLTFSKQKGLPLYKQLYDFIKNEIKLGNFTANEKLPSKRRLANHLKISQITIETAYEQLIAEGYVYSKPKRGYFVHMLDQPLISTKVSKEPKDPRRLKVLRQQESGKSYKYDFKTNVVDTRSFPFATWAKLTKEVMHHQNIELLKMCPPQGDILLRQSIAKYLHEFRGVNCTSEQIIVGAGTEYLLGLLIHILGQKVVFAVENPGYSKTYKILKSYNLEVKFVGLDEDGVKISELEESRANVVYVTPSHHFPLGIIMPINRRLQLLKWARETPELDTSTGNTARITPSEKYIIEDDYDSEFRFNGAPIPALQGLDHNQKVIYLSTFSKSLAPSMRISYMVLPETLLEKYQKDFNFFSSTVSRFEQHTLYKFISGGYFERHLNRTRNIYRTRKDKLVDEVKKMNHNEKINIIGENAGLHLLFRVNNDMTEKELIDSASNVGVKLYGLSDYYFNTKTTIPEGTVVLGYSNFELEEIVEAVRLLEQAWFS